MNESGQGDRVIALVDDSSDDVLLIKRAFERAGLNDRIVAIPSGMEAIAYFKGEPPYTDRSKWPLPHLLLLDIKMPGTDGFDVLRWIRRTPELAGLCVVMLTSSDEIRDANTAYKLGANSFLVKPLDFWNAAELSKSLRHFLPCRANQSNAPDPGLTKLISDLAARYEVLKRNAPTDTEET